MEPRKQAIIDALTKFMNQRSGIEFGNYRDVKAFRAEQRSIYTDLKQARVLLAAVKWRDGIDADALVKTMSTGRLTVKLVTLRDVVGSQESTLGYRAELDYCTGQYFPTEYRRAVCAVLASALWSYTRETSTPPVDGKRDCKSAEGKTLYAQDLYGGKTPGEWLRAYFRKEFGRGIAARWFS